MKQPLKVWNFVNLSLMIVKIDNIFLVFTFHYIKTKYIFSLKHKFNYSYPTLYCSFGYIVLYLYLPIRIQGVSQFPVRFGKLIKKNITNTATKLTLLDRETLEILFHKWIRRWYHYFWLQLKIAEKHIFENFAYKVNGVYKLTKILLYVRIDEK